MPSSSSSASRRRLLRLGGGSALLRRARRRRRRVGVGERGVPRRVVDAHRVEQRARRADEAAVELEERAERVHVVGVVGAELEGVGEAAEEEEAERAEERAAALRGGGLVDHARVGGAGAGEGEGAAQLALQRVEGPRDGGEGPRREREAVLQLAERGVRHARVVLGVAQPQRRLQPPAHLLDEVGGVPPQRARVVGVEAAREQRHVHARRHRRRQRRRSGVGVGPGVGVGGVGRLGAADERVGGGAVGRELQHGGVQRVGAREARAVRLGGEALGAAELGAVRRRVGDREELHELRVDERAHPRGGAHLLLLEVDAEVLRRVPREQRVERRADEGGLALLPLGEGRVGLEGGGRVRPQQPQPLAERAARDGAGAGGGAALDRLAQEALLLRADVELRADRAQRARRALLVVGGGWRGGGGGGGGRGAAARREEQRLEARELELPLEREPYAGPPAPLAAAHEPSVGAACRASQRKAGSARSTRRRPSSASRIGCTRSGARSRSSSEPTPSGSRYARGGSATSSARRRSFLSKSTSCVHWRQRAPMPRASLIELGPESAVEPGMSFFSACSSA